MIAVLASIDSPIFKLISVVLKLIDSNWTIDPLISMLSIASPTFPVDTASLVSA